MKHPYLARFAPLLAVLLLLASCAPGASVLSPPTFTVVPEGSGLVRVEPPGVGTGAAIFRVELRAHNPNPVGLQLAGLDGDLLLDGRPVAASRFAGGLSLPARGRSSLTLDIRAPLTEAPHLVAQIARLIGGEPVPYRLDGTVSVDLLGTTQRFPSVTVARGELRPLPALRPPAVRFDAAASTIRLDGLTAEIEVGLELENPTIVGFHARSPELLVHLGGRVVGRARLPATPVPALGSTKAVVTIRAGLPELGAALLARIQSGGAGLQVSTEGRIEFAAPGLATLASTLTDVGGSLP